MTQTAAIRVLGLTHAYGERLVLAGASLEIGRGEMFGILGPNGGGKTTLFRILSTLYPLTGSGDAQIEGCSVRQNADGVRKQIGVVFQSPSLDSRLTVRENLRHQGHLYGLRGRNLRQRIDLYLEKLRVADRGNDTVSTLSGGLKRRVEIAKGLLHAPRVLLLDEPSTGLDPGARRDLWATLSELRTKENVTVVLTTHIMEEAEGCDRVAILHRGKVIACGSPDALKQEVHGEVIFLDTPNPSAFAAKVKQRFSADGSVLDGHLRIEHPAAQRLLAQIFEAFPGEVRSVTLRKPTLEDVFVHQTGDTFWGEETTEVAR